MFMRKQLLHSIEECIQAAGQLKLPHVVAFIEQASKMVADAFQANNQVIAAGNGGSLCDAAHFAEELTGFFRHYRRPLPAIVLSEPGHLTCTANDVGYEWVFARGVEAYGKAGDVFIGLTTSGNSANIIKAFEMAQQKGLKTIAFLGKGGGKLKGLADLELIVEAFQTSDRIQEVHMAAMHLMVEMIELLLFSKEKAVPC